MRAIQKNGDFISLDDVCYCPDVCYCAELPVTQSEFFNAGMQGIRPEFSLAVDSESAGASAERVTYRGTVYAVYRRYAMASGLTQIFLRKKEGVF